MQSFSKKYRKSFDTYEEAIEKQLHDDFKVNEYLNENQLEGNIEEYLKLVNSLQVNNSQKRKKYRNFEVTYQQMNTERLDKSLELSKISNWYGAKESLITQYEEIQIKTSNELEVKNTLWNEIIQTKKSINLLKGDMGHLVSRNESANIIESKISKVKIVADDQLKRVSLAYSKDKEEFKERKDMQRKFNKKLKNVSMFESSSLSKLKKNYMNTMVKKKQMHDRLAYIEKLSSSIYLTEDKERLKNLTNKNTLEMYRNFEKLLRLIEKVPQLESEYTNSEELNINDLVFQINSLCCIRNNKISKSYFKMFEKSRLYENENEPINSEDLEMVNEENLSKFEEIVKNEYYRLIESIENKTIEYDFNVKKSEELYSKLCEANHEIKKIELDWLNELSSKFVLTPSMKENYFEKLNKFIQTIKTFFILLEFIEKHLNYSTQVSFEKTHEKIMSHTQTFEPNKFLATPKLEHRTNSESSKTLIPEDKSLIITQKSYISDLYKIYYSLLREDPSDSKLEDINQEIFESLRMDVEIWLNEIKNKISEGKGFIRSSLDRNSYRFEKEQSLITRQAPKIRNSLFSNAKKLKTYLETEEEEMNEVKQEYQEYLENFNKRYATNHENSLVRHNSAANFNEKNKLFTSTIGFLLMKGLENSTHSKIGNVEKLKRCSMSSTFEDLKEAKRINFLQNVDKDYFKMIKSTMRMEKENTRKNYEFQKTFNRTKYSSNDEVLEEKRFESSFSMLFTGNDDSKNNKAELPVKKSAFFSRNKSENRLSKLEESRKSLTSSHVFRNEKISEFINNKKLFKTSKKEETKMNDKSLEQKKHHFSIKMKNIINLV